MVVSQWWIVRKRCYRDETYVDEGIVAGPFFSHEKAAEVKTDLEEKDQFWSRLEVARNDFMVEVEE